MLYPATQYPVRHYSVTVLTLRHSMNRNMRLWIHSYTKLTTNKVRNSLCFLFSLFFQRKSNLHFHLLHKSTQDTWELKLNPCINIMFSVISTWQLKTFRGKQFKKGNSPTNFLNTMDFSTQCDWKFNFNVQSKSSEFRKESYRKDSEKVLGQIHISY